MWNSWGLFYPLSLVLNKNLPTAKQTCWSHCHLLKLVQFLKWFSVKVFDDSNGVIILKVKFYNIRSCVVQKCVKWNLLSLISLATKFFFLCIVFSLTGVFLQRSAIIYIVFFWYFSFLSQQFQSHFLKSTAMTVFVDW